MKKQASLRLIEVLDACDWDSDQASIRALLLKQGTKIRLDCLNWAEDYPYAPKTRLWMGRSNTALYLHYLIEEKEIRVSYHYDNAPVWEDSCVEFFVAHPENSLYMNFEFNSLGYCLAAKRKNREDFVLFSTDQLAGIKRFEENKLSLLPGSQGNDLTWSLTICIPFDILSLDCSRMPAELRANFYKCCSACAEKHYLSWSPVHSAKPDFHRPEDFGLLLLKEF